MAPPPPPERDARDAPLPRSQVRTACAVVGCLGLVVVAALGALVYIVLTVLGDLTPPTPTTEKEKPKKASARPAPVGPTALASDRAVFPLPATFDAVGRAANGRFLLLRVPFKGEVAVFDPVEAKVTRTFPLGVPNALFAGGAGKLHVFRPKAKEFDQFDLLTGEKEETAKKPDSFLEPDHLIVGDGVDAPVFALAVGNTRVDAAVIDPAPAKWGLHTGIAWTFLTDARQLRASADGWTIGAGGAKGGAVLNFAPPDKFAAASVQPGLRGHVAPSPNGRHLYSANAKGSRYTFPTAHGDGLFLSVAVGEKGKLEAPLRLHLADTREVVGAIPAALPTGFADDDSSSIPMDQRVHLWPAAGLLAVLPSSNKQIELTKVDVPKLLKDSGKDYFLIGSAPPSTVVRGETLSYRPEVWASPEGTVELEVTGITGLVIKNGQFGWNANPPVGIAEPSVRLVAKHADGRTTDQVFRIRVLDP